MLSRIGNANEQQLNERYGPPEFRIPMPELVDAVKTEQRTRQIGR